MSASRPAVLVVAYPAALLMSQVTLFLLTALLTAPPYTMDIGWQLFRVIAVMALAAALGAALLATLYRSSLPPGWHWIVLGWTAAVCTLALIWAVLSPPGLALEAVLVKPSGVWLVALAGAAGFSLAARARQRRMS